MVPYGNEDRKLMWRVMTTWLRSTQSRNTDVERHLKTVFESLKANVLEHEVPQKDHPLRLHERGWLIGEELERQPNVVPVVTFEAFGTKNAVEAAAFRVALMSLRDDQLTAEGWRFEQAEPEEIPGEPVAHPYAHAQASTGWVKSIPCLIHPPHGDGENCTGLNAVEDASVNIERAEVQSLTLVRHPAFPLGVVTLTGLALSVYTTLYGAPRAKLLFGSLRPLMSEPGEIRSDLQRLALN